MELKIISWNIRHFRKQKIGDYIHTLWEVMIWSDICFIYEDHIGLGEELADALNKYELEQNKKHQQAQQPQYIRSLSHWKGGDIHTLDEYVTFVWKQPYSVVNNTGVAAVFGSLMSGERCPAVVTVSGDKSVVIAAWHAYGPAKVSAKDLFQSVQRVDGCDILIGDFNFQTGSKGGFSGGLTVSDGAFDLPESLDFSSHGEAPSNSNASSSTTVVPFRSARLNEAIHMLEIVPENHKGSTTYTDEGIGKRTSGLDRCLVRKQYMDSVKLWVKVPDQFDEMITLTDHMPLMLIIRL